MGAALGSMLMGKLFKGGAKSAESSGGLPQQATKFFPFAGMGSSMGSLPPPTSAMPPIGGQVGGDIMRNRLFGR
jgi:hypothetical protein